jgi:cell division protein FtsI/penicillin-binding protein 2
MKASASCCLLRTLDRSYRRVILHNHEGYSEISTAKRRQYNALVSLARALQDDASSKTLEERDRCRTRSSSPAWIRRLHNGSVLAVALKYVSHQTPESSETQTKTNKLHLYTSGLDKNLHHLAFNCVDIANSGQGFVLAEQECLELGQKGPVFSMLMASSGLLAGESFHTSCCHPMYMYD